MTKPKTASLFKAVSPYLAPYKGRMILALLAMVVAAATVLAVGQGMRLVVDQGFAAHNQELLSQWSWLLFVIILVMAGASFTRSNLLSNIGEGMVRRLREAVYAHLLRLSPAYYDVRQTGSLLSGLTADTTLIQTVFTGVLPVALRNFIMLVGGLFMLFLTSTKLSLYVLAGVPLILLPIITLGRKLRLYSRQVQDHLAEASAHLSESLQAVRTVQAFGREAFEQQQFARNNQKALLVAAKRNRIRAFLAAMVISLVFGGVTFVLWVGGMDVLSGTMSPGDLAGFVFYAVIVASSVGGMADLQGDLAKASGAMERLLDILNTPALIASPAHPTPLPEPLTGALSLKNLSFAYPMAPDAPTLHDFSLDIAARETVAFVGRSGAGKSTIFSLLQRFYNPSSGQITLDGVPIQQLAVGAYRGVLATVSQEPFIFAGSVADNIRYGNLAADDAAVIAAAKAAYADAFITALPEGYNTSLGEKGVRISVGQKQRIAIARAFLRHPTILLLDEVTSSLDSLSEQHIQQALDHLRQTCTTLIIAHRLSTVQQADRIVVLDSGRISAIGTHQELLSISSLYQELCALQLGKGT